MDPEETVPGQEIDPAGHARVVVDPVSIVTTPATMSQHQKEGPRLQKYLKHLIDYGWLYIKNKYPLRKK